MSCLGLLALSACSAAALSPSARSPTPQLDAAFTAWRKEQRAQALMQAHVQRQVNRLAHPDVNVQLVFEGRALPATVPGSATVDYLRYEAARLHKLVGHNQLHFVLDGETLPSATPISESPLAGSQDLEVVVHASGLPGGDWYSGAASTGGHRRIETASTKAARHAAPRAAASATNDIRDTIAARRIANRHTPQSVVCRRDDILGMSMP